MRSPALTATLWGGAGLLGGAATGVVLLLPLYPQSDDGFDRMGWYLGALVLGGLLALAAGAVLLHRGLRGAGADHPGRTALVFVPVAVLLAAVTAGAGALAAPAAAHWLVDGLTRRADGWGPPRPGGLPQRVILAVVLSGGLAAWGLESLGYQLGGRVNGAALTWLAVLPAVVVPPVLLLRKVLAWPVLATAIAVAAGLLAFPVPAAIDDVHPTPARLEQIATDLPVPSGQSVDDVRTWVHRDGSWETPITVLSTFGPVPPGGTPGAGHDQGAQAALAWERVLDAQGWQRGDLPYERRGYWLPEIVQHATAGRTQYDLGTWTRAWVVPYGDGALVVLSARP